MLDRDTLEQATLRPWSLCCASAYEEAIGDGSIPKRYRVSMQGVELTEWAPPIPPAALALARRAERELARHWGRPVDGMLGTIGLDPSDWESFVGRAFCQGQGHGIGPDDGDWPEACDRLQSLIGRRKKLVPYLDGDRLLGCRFQSVADDAIARDYHVNLKIRDARDGNR